MSKHKKNQDFSKNILVNETGRTRLSNELKHKVYCPFCVAGHKLYNNHEEIHIEIINYTFLGSKRGLRRTSFINEETKIILDLWVKYRSSYQKNHI